MARSLLLLSALAVVAALLWLALSTGAGDEGDLFVPGAGSEDGAASELEPSVPSVAGERSAAQRRDGTARVVDRGAPSTDPDATALAGAVSVLVLGPDFEPVAGTEVSVSWVRTPDDRGVDRGRTDADGGFRTRADVAGEVREISLCDSNGRPELERPGPFECGPGRPTEIVVRLPRRGRVSGRVVDQDGAGIAGARVELQNVASLPLEPFVFVPRRAVNATATTGSDGGFVLEAVEGNHRIAVSDGRHRALHDVRVRTTNEEPDAEVVLYASRCDRSLEVLVNAPAEPPSLAPHLPRVWAESTFVPANLATDFGPRVTLKSAGRSCTGRFRPGAGVYDLTCIDAFPWTLHVTHPGCVPVAQPIATKEERVVVTLQPVARRREPGLRGVVRAPSGAPEEGVVLLLADPGLTRVREADTNALGEFAFDLPIEGYRGQAVHVVARSPGHAWSAAGPVRLPQTDPIVITLQAGRRLTGTVVDAGGVEVAARVELFQSVSLVQPGAGQEERFLPELLEGDRAVAEPGAGFELAGLGTGPFELWAYPDDARLPPGRAVAHAGAHARIVLGAGLETFVTIRGRTVDALSGEPVVGARVSVDRADALASHGGGEATSGEDGEFVLVGHAPGQLRLRVDRQGYATRRLPSRAYEGGEHEVAVQTFPARTVHVQAVNAIGALPRARVSASDADGVLLLLDENGHVAGSKAIADENGRADLRGLPAREVTIAVEVETGGEGEALSFRFDLREEVPGLVVLELPY